MQLSVIIPTHNPHAGRLQQALRALRAQTLSPGEWETVLVDSASIPALTLAEWSPHGPTNLRLVAESEPGLSRARRRGFAEARGEFIVMVDDDNVLAPDYLDRVVALFSAHPKVGALGGRSQPEFELTPPAWVHEFDDLIACRDLGGTPLIATGLRNPATGRNEYPAFAPIGAGMALRRAAATAWLERPGTPRISDRHGSELTSGGDNDIVFCAMQAGWEAGYFPTLSLTHLIPASRTSREYLGRLNRGIRKSWMQVLRLHDANPFPPLTAAGAFLRKGKAWFTFRAWAGPAEYIRWQGACGQFEGQAELPPR